MKVAIVADWLIDFGGAELVIKMLHEIYPEAPIYTSIYDPNKMLPIQDAKIITSPLQKIPFARKHYRMLLPFMPFVFSHFDFTSYDLVITNTHAFSKRILKKGPNTKVLCYCHTPTRYLWDEFGYVEQNSKPILRPLIYLFLRWLRTLDLSASKIPDVILANSHESQRRIKKFYNRDARILYPPVEIAKFDVSRRVTGDYFLAGGRLVPYKRFDLAILAANLAGAKLKIFGLGPDLDRLKSLAGPTIEFLGKIDDEARKIAYSGAIAFVNPQLEDFGITPLEAQASGTPVIAYGRGGVLDTVIDGVTGIFFNEQTPEDLAIVMKNFDSTKFDPLILRRHAEKFSVKAFKQNMRNIVKEMSLVA